MEVILLERIEKLGQMGDVVTVKSGYARNFLLPKSKALRATESNRAHFEAQRTQLEADNLKNRGEAEKVGEKLDGTSVILTRQAGEAGQLYGSVNARDIADAITEAGFSVNRQQVDLGQPIKMIGLHEIAVKLHPELSVTVTANVARSADEAAIQAETGKAVVGLDEEEAAENKIAAEEVFEKAEDAEAAEAVDEEETEGSDEEPAEEAAEAEKDKAE
ncbi:MAG: 50S ribosomal protein L9 [Rhodospirillaceae bacterium]|jgi:large subunit ribosomal protein L9|nr:50S ribosomal protein L9 [Rhodospirillaceae bacterium]MBT4220224.1 50S ribosomal protein L9 [Rhodospirillaceae bacterium]MBT4463328.1 50S ribosomal protein L9 [Rhodospirillaceae bacterium]MBT5014367.1 50S ribosomal protein L9 [Rhodospirillaceae bacterium]MBT5307872.1 50S ribosomal protein L9 [Rhodospirillaceae bacterium]